MSSDRIFSPARFGRLCNKYFIEQRRSLLLTSLSLTAVFIAVALMCGLSYARESRFGLHIPQPTETGWFVVIFAIWGLLMTSSAFKSLGKPTTALATLTCPASQFEQFLMRWMAVVPLFILWGFASAVLADACRVLMTRYVLWCPAEFMDWWEILKGEPGVLGLPDNMLWILLLTFLTQQSFFLLGAVVWSNHHFLKTLATVWLIWVVYMTTGFVQYISFMFDHQQIPVGFHDPSLPIGIFSVIVILFNYTLAYMRFREAEIINRW